MFQNAQQSLLSNADPEAVKRKLGQAYDIDLLVRAYEAYRCGGIKIVTPPLMSSKTL
jgi:hypothetical protein